MFLESRGEHVLVHETAPERSDASKTGMNDSQGTRKVENHGEYK